MEESVEPLLTVAEVAVAFAGFASIVTVVAQRGIESWTEGNILRFRLMIYLSLSSVFFALLPFALLGFEFLRDATWQICSASLALYLGSYLLASTPGIIRLARRRELNPQVVGWSSVVIVGAMVLQMLAALRLIPPSLGSYFVGVLAVLLLAAVSFARLIAVAILPRRPAEGRSDRTD